MQKQKNYKNCSFGFGSEKVAGRGTLDKAVSVSYGSEKKELIKIGLKAAVSIGLTVILKKSFRNKK